MNEQYIARKIRRDFDMLKLPHPSQANIRRPTSYGVTVSWKTRRNSTLYNIVTSIIADQDSKPRIKDAKFQCYIERISLEEKIVTDEPAGELAWWNRERPSRSPSRSPSPPRRNSFRTVERIDTVMESLRKLSDSLNPENLSQSDSVSSQGTVDSPHSYPDPTSMQVCKSRSDTCGETENRLRNELARNQEELTTAVLKAAMIEKELEAFNTSVSPDASQPPDVGIDIRAQLTRAVTELILERRNRRDIELILADVKRECRHPTVVPALLKAMNEISLDMI